MKNIKLLSIPVLMLGIMASSCSKDDDKTPTTPSGAAIKFTVVAPKAPRDASRPETTTATIDYFLLNAFTKGEPYIDNLGVEKESNNWVPAQTIYWPASTVNFYAVSPDIRTGATGRIGNNLMMSYTNEGATDLLYSVAMDQKQTDALNPKPVSLNFRHALSRVVVMMSSNNSLIKVNVSKVALANIYKTGVLSFLKRLLLKSAAASANGAHRRLPSAQPYSRATSSLNRKPKNSLLRTIASPCLRHWIPS